MKLFNRIRFLYAVLKYLSDPNQVDSVLNLGNQFLSKDREPETQKKLPAIPGLSDLVKERFGKNNFPIEYLKTLSTDTLGGAYLKFITDNNLEPYFFKKDFKTGELTDHEYLVWRARQTHDIWHVVTDFKTTQEGEAGLMAFYYAQMRSPLSALLVGLSFIYFLLRKPQELPQLFDEVTRGWLQGQKTLPLIAMRWEDMWAKSLPEIKNDLRRLS